MTKIPPEYSGALTDACRLAEALAHRIMILEGVLRHHLKLTEDQWKDSLMNAHTMGVDAKPLEIKSVEEAQECFRRLQIV